MKAKAMIKRIWRILLSDPRMMGIGPIMMRPPPRILPLREERRMARKANINPNPIRVKPRIKRRLFIEAPPPDQETHIPATY